MKKGKGSALYGLDQGAVDLIYAEQPLHRTQPAEDPLVILNRLDNADKHRLLHQAFVYPGVDRGLDLIDVDRTKVTSAVNLWNAGQTLEDGTPLARLMVHGEPSRAVRVRPDALIGFASGELGAPRTSYTDMIARVRGIADQTVALIDR